MIAPPVDEEFARAKVHPFPRFISKHPIKVVALLYAAYVVLAVLGVTAIRVRAARPRCVRVVVARARAVTRAPPLRAHSHV